MFDLEAALDQWNRRASADAKFDEGFLMELEDHLREETAALVAEGLTLEAAWRTASTRLGSVEQISREYAKVARMGWWDRAAFGLLFGVAAMALGGLLVALALRGGDLLREPLLGAHVAMITGGYMIGLWTAAVAGYSVLRRLLSARSPVAVTSATLRLVRWTSAAATALTIVGFVLGSIWAAEEWGQAFTSKPAEWGGLGVLLTLGAATWAAWRRTPRAELATCAIAIVGGGVVLMAWFGVASLDEQAPSIFAVVSFGGLAASLLLAAISLRRESATA